MSQIQIVQTEDQKKIILPFPEGKGFIDCSIHDGKTYLLHSEVPEQLKGIGAAQSLVKATLEYLALHERKAKAICNYIKHYISKNSEWQKIVE